MNEESKANASEDKGIHLSTCLSSTVVRKFEACTFWHTKYMMPSTKIFTFSSKKLSDPSFPVCDFTHTKHFTRTTHSIKTILPIDMKSGSHFLFRNTLRLFKL